MKRAPILAVLLAAVGAASAAAKDEPDSADFFRSIRAARRTGPIALDGRLDEPAWQAAELGDGFLQHEPDEGAPPSVQTRFRVLWDDEFIYVGIECDDPEPPTATLSRRDRFIEGDFVSFDFDTTLDRRTAYHFQVFAAGQQLDALHFNDTDFTTDWDAAWESAVARTDKGWSVEAKIPLRILRISDGARAFGFNVYRKLARRREEDQWRYRPRGAPGDISQLGLLTGLDGIRPVRSLELRPYLASRFSSTRPAPAYDAPRRDFGLCSMIGMTPASYSGACAGLDLRYSVASDLSLVATVNPDFGQVEVDQRVLNLSTFETFFPEKRPFFLEGLDLFQSPLKIRFGGPYGGDAYRIFYSRRLGRPPPVPDGTVVYEPAARPVATAIKLSGSVGSTSVGLLSAVEPRVDAQMLGDDGKIFSQRAAEAVHSAAVRLRAPVGDRAIAGFIGTARTPLFASPGLGLSRRHAHVAGADLTVFDGTRNWSFVTQVAGSRIAGGDAETLRDGTVLGDGTTGGAVSAKLNKDGGRVTGFAAADLLSPGFTVNDLGFMPRANLFRSFGLIALRDVHPNSWRQRAQIGLWGREIRDGNLGLTLERDIGVETFVLLNSQWSFGTDLIAATPNVDDRELGDGTPIQRHAGGGGGAFVNTDPRKPLQLNLSVFHLFSPGHGEPYTEIGGNLRFRPLPQLEGSLELFFNEADGVIRKVRAATAPPGLGDPTVKLDAATATQKTRLYLVGPQHARSASATLRTTYAFTPRLTLQAYAQLFVAGLAYRSPLRAVLGPGKRTVTFSELSPALPEDRAPNADDRQAALNINLILRWEWRLGSTLYLVYAHQSSNDITPPPGSLSLGRGLSTLSAPAATHGDTFLVKMDLFSAL